MIAIINSQYIIKNIENFTLSLQNILLEFDSEEAKITALKLLKELKYINVSSKMIQFPANSGLISISIFENYDS